MKIRKKGFTTIIPAAGKSSRFKNKKSKIFYQLTKNKTILEKVIDKVLNYSDKIIIIGNSSNLNKITEISKKYKNQIKIDVLIQKKINGMEKRNC